jgi:hypothetical protein
MYSCVLVDIVPVSSEQPVEVDQEQVFEKEEHQCLSKEGKWSSPPALFYFILCNCMTTKFIFIMLLHYGLRTYLDFYPQSLDQPCLIIVFG